MPSKRKITPEVIMGYEKAQDSAEHHNTMIWVLMPIALSFWLYMLKILFLERTLEGPYWVPFVILSFAVSSMVIFSSLIESANEKKMLKYELCKAIERAYNLIRQHEITEKLDYSIKSGIYVFRVTEFVLFMSYFLTFVGLITVHLKTVSNEYFVIPIFTSALFGIAASQIIVIIRTVSKRDYKQIIEKYYGKF